MTLWSFQVLYWYHIGYSWAAELGTVIAAVTRSSWCRRPSHMPVTGSHHLCCQWISIHLPMWYRISSSAAKWGVHIYDKYAEYEHVTILHIPNRFAYFLTYLANICQICRIWTCHYFAYFLAYFVLYFAYYFTYFHAYKFSIFCIFQCRFCRFCIFYAYSSDFVIYSA